MATVIVYTAPDPTADYTFAVVDAKTGNSYSPGTGAFAAAPADELIKMIRDLSPNRPAVRYGFVATELTPPTPYQYLIQVHPAAGGPPVGDAFFIASVAVKVSPGFNLAVNF